jgi:hypothetical protein
MLVFIFTDLDVFCSTTSVTINVRKHSDDMWNINNFVYVLHVSEIYWKMLSSFNSIDSTGGFN